MKAKKISIIILSLAFLLQLFACAAPVEQPAAVPNVEPATQPAAVVTDEEYAQWAEKNGYVLNPEENGYMKMAPDIISSATLDRVGGVNYGAIEWDNDLRASAIKEFLKGGTFIGDPAFAQDDTGHNYREMYQMATSFNNIPANTNLELVLDASNLHLLGVSEANTGKTIEFALNPSVSLGWCRQLRPEEEEMYNYYCSYGIQYNGTVRVFTARDLESEEGKEALLNLFDKYYPTISTNWGAYKASFAELTDEAEIKEAKLNYITTSINRGTMVAYEITPTNIVLTAPFIMNMSPSMSNAAGFTTAQQGKTKYNYTLGLSDTFIDKLVDYKVKYISTTAGVDEVTAYYSEGRFPALDEVCATYNVPTSLEFALMENNAAGLKTQTTYTP